MKKGFTVSYQNKDLNKTVLETNVTYKESNKSNSPIIKILFIKTQ